MDKRNLNKLELKILFAANINKHIKLTRNGLKNYFYFLANHLESMDEISILLTSLVNIKDYRHLFPRTGIRPVLSIPTESRNYRFIVHVKQDRQPPYNLKVTIENGD